MLDIEDLQVGLFNCAVTKQLDKCVAMLLGTLGTEDHGEIEVWGSFSETGLRSLRHDLLHPEEERPGCVVGPGECCVTGRETETIRALVAVIPEMVNGESTGREALVYVCLSEAGIDSLLARLEGPSKVLDLQPLVAATRDTPYGWLVVHADDEVVAQFVAGEAERPFSDVRLDQVGMLLVEPKDLNTDLPSYRLTAEGFAKILRGSPHPQPLPLPVPAEPFVWHYYRRVTVTFACEEGTGQPMPPRILQVLGWRVARPEGDLTCELGVEEDGTWIVYRRGRLHADGRYEAMCEEEFEAALTSEGG